jgi:lysophospholipase L1-like esterase
MRRAALGFALLCAAFALWTFWYRPGDDIDRHRLRPHFGGERDYYMRDAIAGHIHRPRALREFEWPEHPDGKIVMRTNNMGFREDADTPLAKPAGVLRVLVTGDSHTDGVVSNPETFVSVAERIAIESGQALEMLNGGVGYYGPQNYRGFLERFLPLRPDIFVVALYTGNDFIDALRIESENRRLTLPERPPNYFGNLAQLEDKAPAYAGQVLNQALLFKAFPELTHVARELTQEAFTRIHEICERERIRLLVLLLPAKTDVEPDTDAETTSLAVRLARLSPAEAGIGNDLAQEIANWLDERGIAYLDLREPLSSEPDELYWRSDLHLNHAGHGVVGRLLAEALASMRLRQEAR